MIANYIKKALVIFLFYFGMNCTMVYSQTTEIAATLPDPCMTLSLHNNISDDDFTLYPNPSNGIVKLLFDTTFNIDKMQITIYDMNGKLVYRENNLTKIDDIFTVKVENLNSGIYFIKIQSDDIDVTKKLIIK